MRRELSQEAAAANAYAQSFITSPENEDAYFHASNFSALADHHLKVTVKALILKEKYPDIKDLIIINDNKNIRINFDITDLILHFRRKRLLTGIQRIQAEIVYASLLVRPNSIGICVFFEGLNAWKRIPIELFRELIVKAEESSDASDNEWIYIVGRLNGILSLSEDALFSESSTLVSLGANWSVKGHTESISYLKNQYNIRYIPFIHDLIPVKFPHLCVNALVDDYRVWINKVVPISDTFMVNSKSTGRDLIEYTSGTYPNIINYIKVIKLDAEIGIKSEQNSLKESSLPEKFVLLVSTIEPRKGHIYAAQAWVNLFRKYNDSCPHLVCIGQNGWKTEAFYEFLSKNPEVTQRITILNEVCDELLLRAYQSCICSLYPSLYEGWGLPITESLCFGKIPITARNSSLTEAGGEYAEYFISGDSLSLFASVEKIVFDHNTRRKMEANIRSNFRPRSWQDIAQQIVSFIEKDNLLKDSIETIL